MPDQVQRSWNSVADHLEEFSWNVPAARANAELLRRAAPQWEDRVVARTSMHDLLFTNHDDDYPFKNAVRVSWKGDVYELWLTRLGLIVSGDKCTTAKVDLVLSAFLVQLAGGET